MGEVSERGGGNWQWRARGGSSRMETWGGVEWRDEFAGEVREGGEGGRGGKGA